MNDWLIQSAWRASPLSILLILGGCNFPVHQPSISEALDPQLAAPYSKSLDWHPRPGQYTSVDMSGTGNKVPSGKALVEPKKTYKLSDLVDLGLRANPATRSAWEQARAAAAGLGIAEAAWLPALTAKGYYQYAQQASGIFLFRGTTVQPVLGLSWTLFDKSRPAKIDQAMQQLIAANFRFNRTHQKVAYDVQRAFFDYNAALAQVVAAEVTVRQTE